MKPGPGAETLLATHARPLYDALPNPVWLVDAAGRLLLVNRAWRAYTGRDEAEVLGQPFAQLLHPGERAEVLGRWQAAQGPGEEVGGAHRLRGAGGEYGWFALRARPAPEIGPGLWAWTAHELDREETAPPGERLHALERAYQDAELLAALAAALQGAATPEQVAEQALRLIGPALGAISMLVVRLDGEQIRLPTIWGDTPPVIVAHMTRPGLTLAGAPLLARAAREGQGVYLADYRAEPGTLPTFPSLACGVEPVRTPGGTLEGFLVVWRPVGQQSWGPEERRLLRRAAGTLGLALERAAAAQRLGEEAAALDAFVAFSEAVGHETDVYALARRAGEVLRATLGGVSVAYYELEGGLWRARVWTEDIAPETVESITRGLPQDAPSFARAVEGQVPVFVAGWDAAREAVEHTEAYGAVALFPYFGGPGPRSLLAAGTREARTWTEREQAVFLAVGRSLGLSLERADAASRLAAQNAELKARARALEGFAELTRDLSLRADPHALVRRALEVVLSLLPQGYALYFELEEGRWRVRAQVGDVGHPGLQALNDAGFDFDGPPSLYRPWQTREPLYQDAYAKDTDLPPNLVAHINTVASLPVLVHGEPVGIFVVCVFEERRWTGTDRVIMETVVRSLGIAMEAAQGVADLARRTREVAEWRERYEVAVQGSGNVLYDWNAATGEMVYGGPLEEITGYTPGELARSAAMWMDTLVHPEDRAAFREEALRAVRGRAVLHTGFRVRRKDGSVREVETDGHFVWNDQDEVVRMVGLIRDVTERREAEERLRRSNEELRRSNAELEQFAYVASHDLQAPLRAVTSFAELALRRYGDRLDERGQLYLRQIVENGQHMKRLVDDLLGFSRLNTQPRHPRAADANAVFDGVARRLAAEVEEAGGRLTRGPLPCVLADPARLDQLLQNLLSNALKYRREGVPPRVQVSARRDGERWRFAVRDNGIGIEPQYFERIFVIFQRLHGREEFDGTGIGLAVCKKIVEQHGGELWLESVPGEGTTFFFTLPACPPEGPGAEPASPAPTGLE